ncbi:MAG: TonB-dependent receptor [Steroidobacteraceae bacterium]
MKKFLVEGSTLALFCGFASGAMAQTAATDVSASGDSGTLEEIVVTAERRSQDLQKVPASIAVLQGDALRTEGRVSTQQILEDIPNVIYAPPNQVAGGGGGGGDNPNGNITIRGVQSTQQTAGIAGPSATATYVDDVYQGIGGDYDVSRVEVLRGPQGTLYGRSATGGVVAFHTNDPQLGKFGGDVSAEVGTADLRNATVALNLPLGDQWAVRIAAHDYERDGYYTGDGGFSRTEEGRIKVLYQPSDHFKLQLSASTEKIEANSTGQTPSLSAPDTIDYNRWPAQDLTPVAKTAPTRFNQYAANLDYDFDNASLIYAGSMHTYSRNGFSGYYVSQSGVQTTQSSTPLDQFNTQELRLQSNQDGKLQWVIGGSFYSQMYNYSATSLQTEGYEGGPGIPTGTVDPNPAATPGTFMFSQINWGQVKDYGLFTEETYALTDQLKLTGGVRYDRTKVNRSTAYIFNQNLDSYLTSLSPPTNAYFDLTDAERDFDNVTFKLRAAYEFTPNNSAYAMVSTGFLPGDTQVTPVVNIVNAFNGEPVTVDFKVLPYDQERLTSFEIGSKNQFLDDTLQLNGAVYYYDYQGYQEAVNTAPNSPIPAFATVAVPVRMIGAEVDGQWLPTRVDRLVLSAGVVNTKITDFPGITGQYIGQTKLPGVAPATAALTYSHTSTLPNGSTLIPRAQARYTGAYYVETLTPSQAASTGADFDHQDAYEIYDFNLTWNSPSSMYSATAYVRNIGDTVYKAALNGGSSFAANTTTVTPSDPRTYGVSVNVTF